MYIPSWQNDSCSVHGVYMHKRKSCISFTAARSRKAGEWVISSMAVIRSWLIVVAARQSFRAPVISI